MYLPAHNLPKKAGLSALSKMYAKAARMTGCKRVFVSDRNELIVLDPDEDFVLSHQLFSCAEFDADYELINVKGRRIFGYRINDAVVQGFLLKKIKGFYCVVAPSARFVNLDLLGPQHTEQKACFVV